MPVSLATYSIFQNTSSVLNTTCVTTRSTHACTTHTSNARTLCVGFPFGSYGTDGSESLSLVLYAYRLLRPSATPKILFVCTNDKPPESVLLCAERLGMTLTITVVGDLPPVGATEGIAAVMTSFDSPELDTIAAWATRSSIPLHVHVRR